jgi:lysophospholipase L1-like esterase
VSLGVFEVDGVPSVTLSTESPDGYPETHPGGWLVDKSDDVAWENSNEDIAFDAVAFVPLPQKPRDIVVALGDSFSSGEGSGSYYAETDFTSSNTSLRDGCHRSPVTWSRRATLPGATLPVGARADAWDPTLDYHLLACSGALVGHVLRNVDYASGRWGEAFQLERNFLDDNTTLVTVSAGGNDAEFMNTFFTCFGAGECYAQTEDDGTTFDDTTNDNIDAAGDRLETLLGRIRAEAPNAKVLVMGYPPLLSGKCGVMTGWALSAAEITWLNEKAGVLAQRMDDATNDANTSAGATFATFADPEPYFRNRGVCSAVPLINGPVLDTLDPNEVLMSAAQTLHPNADGYIAYGQAMTDTLSAITP